MSQKLSTRQRLICGALAALTGSAYFIICLLAIGWAFQRKEGDIPPVPPWLENAGLEVVRFPFGFVPGLGSVFITLFLNGLFWGALAGAFYVWLLRRKMA